jgi:iron(III) transport system ATP-binding protein
MTEGLLRPEAPSPLAAKTLVQLDGVTKVYPQSRQRALNGLSLTVAEGEFVALLGPSGSGKTTALRCIAGLESVTAGEIRLRERLVSSPRGAVSPAERNIGMVFQSYALWPHMTVFDNVAYALKVQHVPVQSIRARVIEMLSLLGLDGMALSYPHQLSGGQQQRVALARALVAEPSLILFDEPLSNLDARLRDSMRAMIRDLMRRLGVAGVYVTHDRLDALVMADRVLVMNHGVVIQEGTPEGLYARPGSAFVARFLGDVNVYDGTVVSAHGDHVRIAIDGSAEELGALTNGGQTTAVGTRVQAVIRPNQVRLHSPTITNDDFNELHGTLERVTFLGEVWRSRVQLGSSATPLELLTVEQPTRTVGESIDLYVSYAHVTLLPPERDIHAEPAE